MNNDLEVAHSRSGSSSTIPSRVGIQKWVLREKPLGAKERTTSNSNHIQRRRRDLNLAHNSGRRVLSLLLHPCSPIVLVAELSIQCGSQTPVRTFLGLLFDPGLSNHDAHAPTKTWQSKIVSRFSVLWLTSTITDQIIKRSEEGKSNKNRRHWRVYHQLRNCVNCAINCADHPAFWMSQTSFILDKTVLSVHTHIFWNFADSFCAHAPQKNKQLPLLFHAGILRKLQIERSVLENWKMYPDSRWILFWI